MLQTKMVDGIRVNPVLPEIFNNTPNEERSGDEIDQWWGVPYIEVDAFSVPDKSEVVRNCGVVHWNTQCGDPNVPVKLICTLFEGRIAATPALSLEYICTSPCKGH